MVSSSLSIPIPTPQVFTTSWYGNESGSTRADGKPFNPKEMTAASRTLPLGTHLRLMNPAHPHNILEVVVRDRGPYVCGRDLDLSEGAARRLGFLKQGVVDLLVMNPNDLPPQRASDSPSKCLYSSVRKSKFPKPGAQIAAHLSGVPPSFALLTKSKPHQVVSGRGFTDIQQPPVLAESQAIFIFSPLLTGRTEPLSGVEQGKSFVFNEPTVPPIYRLQLLPESVRIATTLQSPPEVLADIHDGELVQTPHIRKVREKFFQKIIRRIEGTRTVHGE